MRELMPWWARSAAKLDEEDPLIKGFDAILRPA
jgi:hypothetical protein